MNNERGVTLTMLALTVAILAILAGVSIRLGLTSNSSIVREVENETAMQEEMIIEEQRKTENAIQKYEDEWGL